MLSTKAKTQRNKRGRSSDTLSSITKPIKDYEKIYLEKFYSSRSVQTISPTIVCADSLRLKHTLKSYQLQHTLSH